MPDVTIIGGGPAGSTAAILLARAGWDVTLLEQSRFPRDKVCGECLSALGFEVLTRLRLDDVFRAAGAVRLDHADVHAPSGRSRRVPLPTPMWGLSRRRLDGLLLEAARAAGAVVRQPARCEGIEAPGEAADAARHERRPESSAREVSSRNLTRGPAAVVPPSAAPPDRPGPVHVRVRDLTNSAVQTIAASYVILADGKGAFAFAGDAPAPTGDFGIKTHFANVDGPRDTIELFGVRGSYGGLAAIEGGRWNAAFSVPGTRLKSHRGDIDALFAELISENPVLARSLAGAERVGDWLASPLPRFAVRKRWSAHLIPVGNAAAALEPIGGEGMGLAMRSAELAAAELVASATRDGGAPADRQRRLTAAYRGLWQTRRFGCRAAAVAASAPGVANFITLRRPPAPLVRGALRLIGKVPAPARSA